MSILLHIFILDSYVFSRGPEDPIYNALLHPGELPWEYLVGIYRCSQLYHLQRGILYSVAHLYEHRDIPEAQRLMIGLEQHDSHLFESSLRWLVTYPLNDWTDFEDSITDGIIRRRITRTQWVIFAHWAYLASYPPVADPTTFRFTHTCGMRHRCKDKWLEAWKRIATPTLLEGSIGSNVWYPIKMKMDTDETEVCAECRQYHVDAAATAFAEDDTLVNVVVRELMESFGFED